MIRRGQWVLVSVTCALVAMATACGNKNNSDDGNDDADADADADDSDDSDDTPIDAAVDGPAIDAALDASIDGPTPDAPNFSIGGTLVGLTSGSATVTVTTSGGTDAAVLTADGPFTLGPFPYMATYSVTVATTGGSPANTCYVGNGDGSVGNMDITNVRVECSPPDLKLTEVASCYYANSSCWVEVFNSSAAAISLAGYTLRSPAVNLGNNPPTGVASQTFTLPALSIPAGGYAIVRGKPTADTFAGPQVATIVTGQIVPIWSDRGFVELVKGGRTVDFVTFGLNITAPTSVGWKGGNVGSLPTGDAEYGKAIIRTATTDTNTNADWAVRAFTTPGGPNDITSDTDADADGIPDQAETSGGRFAGVDLFAMGARTGRRDIFIQIDRMNSADPGVIPRREALQRIVDVFNTHSIAVHFDTGTLFAATFDPANFNLGGGNILPFSAFINTTATGGAANLHELKAANMDIRLSPVFHYMVFGSQSSAPAAGGRGELFGNDVIITQGNSGFTTTPAAALQFLINSQAEVVMHELGHNLGLAHGGDAEVNMKPNYVSVMNYLYSYRGLPTIGNAEGDRYYLQRGGCGVTSDTQLVNGPYGTSHVLDYSNGSGTALTETALNEALGLGRSGSVAVDWNCNGSATSGVTADVNFDGGTSTLTDYNDWANLRSAFARGFSGNERRRGPAGRIDPVANDHQTWAPEAPGALRHSLRN